MSRRKSENRCPDPVEVLARSFYRYHKAGIRQIRDLLCNESQAGTGFFSPLDHLLSWWEKLSGLSVTPFHLNIAPEVPVPDGERPAPDQRAHSPAYSDVQVWSVVSLLSRAETTAIWNNFYHAPVLAPFPGMQGLKEPGHPYLSDEPAGAEVSSRDKSVQDRSYVPSFASTVSSYTRLAIKSREVISRTLEGPHGAGSRYPGPRPVTTIDLLASQRSAPDTGKNQKTGYMGGDLSRTTISVPRPAAGHEPGDQKIPPSEKSGSPEMPPEEYVAVRDLLTQSARFHASYKYSGVAISRSVFQGLVSRDIQITRATRDDTDLQESEGKTGNFSGRRAEIHPEGIFRFLFRQPEGMSAPHGSPVFEMRATRGEERAWKPDMAAPRTSVSGTRNEIPVIHHKLSTYRVGVPILSPRKEFHEAQKESPEQVIPGLDNPFRAISPLIPPPPAGIVHSDQPPAGHLSVSETTHPLSLLISHLSSPASPLATGPWKSLPYHTVIREVLERLITTETPIRRITAFAHSFSDHQDNTLKEIVTLMTFPVRDVSREGHARTAYPEQGPSGVPGQGSPGSYASAVLQAPGMAILAGPRPCLSPPPSAQVSPAHPSVSASSHIVDRDSRHSTLAPAGATNHFHNDFHISVQVRDGSDERELRDLGRKIGRILSDELARYGGVL